MLDLPHSSTCPVCAGAQMADPSHSLHRMLLALVLSDAQVRGPGRISRGGTRGGVRPCPPPVTHEPAARLLTGKTNVPFGQLIPPLVGLRRLVSPLCAPSRLLLSPLSSRARLYLFAPHVHYTFWFRDGILPRRGIRERPPEIIQPSPSRHVIFANSVFSFLYSSSVSTSLSRTGFEDRPEQGGKGVG